MRPDTSKLPMPGNSNAQSLFNKQQELSMSPCISPQAPVHLGWLACSVVTLNETALTGVIMGSLCFCFFSHTPRAVEILKNSYFEYDLMSNRYPKL